VTTSLIQGTKLQSTNSYLTTDGTPESR